METVIPVQWNPYLESESESAVSRLRDEQVDLAVMDCFGYSRKMRDFAAQSLGKPVILSARWRLVSCWRLYKHFSVGPKPPGYQPGGFGQPINMA